MIKSKKLLLFAVLAALFFCSAAALVFTSRTAAFKAFAEDTLVLNTNANGDDFEQSEKHLTQVYGSDGVAGSAFTSFKRSLALESVDGATDGKALKFVFNSWGLRAYYGIEFASPINVDSIGSLNLRVYMHLSDGDYTVKSSNGVCGVCIYGLSQDGTSQTNVVRLTGALVQDEWTDISLSRANVRKLLEVSDGGLLQGIIIGSVNAESTLYDNTVVGGALVENAYMYLDTVSYSPKSDNEMSLDDLKAKDMLLFSADTADVSAFPEGKVAYINGVQKGPGDTDLVTDRGPKKDEDNSATSGYSLKYSMHSWAAIYFNKALPFSKTVYTEDTAAIVIRLYAHLSSSDTYQTANGGIVLYGLGETGQEKAGYMIPANIVQDEWTDLVLYEKDLKALADENGEIKGLEVCACFQSSNDASLYQGLTTAYIAIDYVSISGKVELTYKDGIDGDGSVIKDTFAYVGTTARDIFIPERSGYAFIGWYRNGELFHSKTMITEDTVLVAHWSALADSAANAGLYKSTSLEGKYAAGAGYVFIGLDGAVDLSDLYEEDDFISVAFTEGGVAVIEKDFKVKVYNVMHAFTKFNEFCTVNFDCGTFVKTFRIETGGHLNAWQPERTGHIFVKWLKGASEFNFAAAVDADMSLTAKWDYDPIEDRLYPLYQADFYNETAGFIKLNGDKTAKIIPNVGAETTCDYLLLKGGLLVLLDENGNETCEMTLFVYRLVAGETTYFRLGEFIVVFNDSDGSELDRKNVPTSTYILTDVPTPEKEGYVFVEWRYADGEKVDFSKIVTGSFSAYAVWAIDENAKPEDEGQSGGCRSAIGADSAIASAAVLLACGAVIFTLRKKEGK